MIARLVAQDMAAALGQAVVIENRVGANGNIATESVAAAPADGYTILVNTLALNVNAILGQVRAVRPIYQPCSDHFCQKHGRVLPFGALYGDLRRGARSASP